MTVRRKRKPTGDPEQQVRFVGNATASLTEPRSSTEDGSERVPESAVSDDLVDESSELSAERRVRDDMTMAWPFLGEAVTDMRADDTWRYAQLRAEPPVDLIGVPGSFEWREPQRESPGPSCWIYDITEGLDPSPVEPIEEREGSGGWCRVVLVGAADHDEDP